MKIFNDLQDYEAVKVGDKINIQLPRGTYDVNGCIIESPCSGRQVLLENGVTILRKHAYPKELSKWMGDDGWEVTKEERDKVLREKGKYWDDEAEDWNFPSLDVEYEVKKKALPYEALKPIYIQKDDEWNPIDVSIIGVWEDAGSEFIETPYQIGLTKFASEGGVCKLHLSSLARHAVQEWAKDMGLSLEMPTHSHLEYAKVEGRYIFTGWGQLWVKRANIVNIFKTIEEAKYEEDALKNQITNHLDKLFAGKFSEVLRGEVYQDLLTVKDKLCQLDVKVKDAGGRMVVVNMLKRVIDKL